VPHRAGGTRIAARRQRRTDRAGRRANLRSPCFRAHAAVSAGARALPGFHCASCGARPLAARDCARGVRVVPALRRARARLPACGVRALPCRAAAGVFLQEAWVLPQLRRTPHGRECAASRGGGVRPAPGAAMGAEFSLSLALPVRQQARRQRPGAGDRASRDRGLAGGSGAEAGVRVQFLWPAGAERGSIPRADAAKPYSDPGFPRDTAPGTMPKAKSGKQHAAAKIPQGSARPAAGKRREMPANGAAKHPSTRPKAPKRSAMTPQSPLNPACAASGYRADCPKRASEKGSSRRQPAWRQASGRAGRTAGRPKAAQRTASGRWKARRPASRWTRQWACRRLGRQPQLNRTRRLTRRYVRFRR